LRRFACLVALCAALGAVPAAAQPLRHFVYLGQDELVANLPILDRPDIAGAEVIYVWRSLEPHEGEYDFSIVEDDLALTAARGKQLFVEVGDRFFAPDARYLPRYLLEEPQYGGGLARQFDNSQPGRAPTPKGWIARQWDPELRARFQALLSALAERFDGRIAGVVLTETAATVDPDAPPLRSSRKASEGLRTSRSPASAISNTPTSSVDPNRFFTARSTRKCPCRSPSR
jgi:hypothetical protein